MSMRGTEASTLLASPGTHATALDLELRIRAMLLPGLWAYRGAAWLPFVGGRSIFPVLIASLSSDTR